MTEKFQTVLLGMSRIDATQQTTGGCHWEAKKSQAFDVVKGFLAHYPGNEFDLCRALELAHK